MILPQDHKIFEEISHNTLESQLDNVMNKKNKLHKIKDDKKI
jgi:hypothetical protein